MAKPKTNCLTKGEIYSPLSILEELEMTKLTVHDKILQYMHLRKTPPTTLEIVHNTGCNYHSIRRELGFFNSFSKRRTCMVSGKKVKAYWYD